MDQGEFLIKRIEELEKELSIVKEKSLRYELLFDLSAYAVLVIENERFVDCNQAAAHMLGYEDKHGIINAHPSELSPKYQPDGELSLDKARRFMDKSIECGSHHFEWIHTKANGEEIPVEVWLSSIKYGDKYLFNTIWKDLSDLRLKENKIKAALKEKEFLLKEIHHRVKNNLQVITSLMSLQSDYVDDEQAKKVFKNSQLRINSMAVIHEMLYQRKDISTINYGEYLEELIPKIITSLKEKNQTIHIDLKYPDFSLNLDTAIPLGLIINEIVTNSMKYAFIEQNNPELTLHITQSENNKYRMEIGDNGCGYSDEINYENNKSLGLKLIYTLTHQLRGKVVKDTNKRGTNYNIEFQEI